MTTFKSVAVEHFFSEIDITSQNIHKLNVHKIRRKVSPTRLYIKW